MKILLIILSIITALNVNGQTRKGVPQKVVFLADTVQLDPIDTVMVKAGIIDTAARKWILNRIDSVRGTVQRRTAGGTPTGAKRFALALYEVYTRDYDSTYVLPLSPKVIKGIIKREKYVFANKILTNVNAALKNNEYQFVPD